MSANQSNLSNPKYGYDMVVATTQTAVNATMQEWLSKYKGKPFIQAYVYNPEQDAPAYVDFDKLKTELGFDPFTIPDKTDPKDPRIAKLMDKKFMFAFQVEIGLPDFPLDKIPPVIQFNKEGTYVTYNMVCKTFKILVLEPGGYTGAKWTSLSQDKAQAPWVFSFTVDLDLRTDNINNYFHNLPIETQNDIKNLGQDMFSIQQLFLDLNAAGLSAPPTISGLEPTSTAYVYLSRIFVNKYLADLSKNGGVMLGFSVVSKKPFPQNVSLIPTNMTFMISSYKDDQGKATADYNAYTLNYLIMSKDRPMPAPNQFSWNWVEKDKTSQYAGVMSVNRNSFIAFLHGLLSPELQRIAMVPSTNFYINCLEAKFSWSFSQNGNAQAFNIVNNGGSHVLTYSYTKSTSADDSTYCGIYGTWGNFGSTYSVQSDVYLDGTTIRTETTMTVFMHLNVLGGVTEGNFAKKKAVTKYTLGVNNQGVISVDWGKGPEVTDMSDNIDPGFWSKFVTLGQITGVVDGVRNNVKTWLDSFLTNDASNIARMLNGSNSWVFPGGNTYAFMNARFSDSQDLVANVLYVSPKLKRAQIEMLLASVRETPELLYQPNLSFATLMKSVEEAEVVTE